MLNLDFYYALAAYLSLVVAVFLIKWLCGGRKEGKRQSLDPKFVWFCSVCSYTYINTKEEPICLCPRCGSYNKK